MKRPSKRVMDDEVFVLSVIPFAKDVYSVGFDCFNLIIVETIVSFGCVL